jgi:protein TonB
MNAFALHHGTDQAEIRRWGMCAAAILTAHALLIVLGMNWYTQRPTPGVRFHAIMVDMAPVSSSPQPTPMDLARGP